jgi:thiol-disulfide isomerase/thioredoxin
MYSRLKQQWSNRKFSAKFFAIFGIVWIGALIFLFRLIQPNNKISLIIVLSCAITLLLSLVFCFGKNGQQKTIQYIAISIGACLIKMFLGAFLDIYTRFLCDILIYFIAGIMLSSYKMGNLSSREIFLLLILPVLMVFLPIVHQNINIYFYPLAYTPLFAFGMLMIYRKTQYKSLFVTCSIFIVALLSFVAYPNYCSYLSGAYRKKQKMIDSRVYLPIVKNNGDTTSISIMNKKLIIIDAWYTGCGICIKQFPEFEKLAMKYKIDTNIYFATLNIPLKNEISNNIAFDLTKKYSFAKLKALDNINDNKWDIQSYPTILVFDQNKYLIYKGSFYSNKNIVINNLDAIVNRHISNQ